MLGSLGGEVRLSEVGWVRLREARRDFCVKLILIFKTHAKWMGVNVIEHDPKVSKIN